MAISLNASNAQILNAVRDQAGLEYQMRIPAVSDGDISKALKELDKYTPMWNIFMSTLLNTIGLRMFNENLYENRLRPLKSGSLAFGGMVEEYSINLIQAEEYDVNDTNVFEVKEPDMEVNWHRINSRRRYPLTINEDLIAEACESDGGLSALITYIMQTPQNSAEWDEYLLMMELLAKYQTEDGFANVQVSDILSAQDPEAAGKQLVKAVSTWYEKSKFYRRDTNAAGIDAVSNSMILLTTPEIQSSYSTDVLAAAFNMSRAEFMADRVITVDKFPDSLSGTQAILLDADWYKVFDTKNKVASIYNPKTLNWNHFLHRWGIFSCSRMRPAIRFSTAEGNINVPAVFSVDGVTAVFGKYDSAFSDVTYDGPGTVNEDYNTLVVDDTAGLKIPLDVDVHSMDDDSHERNSRNAYWLVTGSIAPIVTTHLDSTTGELVYAYNPSGDVPDVDASSLDVILPDTGTYVDRDGYLHIAPDMSYSALKITAISAQDPTHNASINIFSTAQAAALEFEI